jgi:hypothetical protein
MTGEQIRRLVNGMTRPIYIYRMAQSRLGSGTPAQEAAWQKRIEQAHDEIEKVITELFGPDLEDEPPHAALCQSRVSGNDERHCNCNWWNEP